MNKTINEDIQILVNFTLEEDGNKPSFAIEAAQRVQTWLQANEQEELL